MKACRGISSHAVALLFVDPAMVVVYNWFSDVPSDCCSSLQLRCPTDDRSALWKYQKLLIVASASLLHSSGVCSVDVRLACTSAEAYLHVPRVVEPGRNARTLPGKLPTASQRARQNGSAVSSKVARAEEG
jgi:hypothetical protein